MAEQVICTSECEDCIFSTLDDSNKSKILIYCGNKDKTYYYGQMIPCDNKTIRKEKE